MILVRVEVERSTRDVVELLNLTYFTRDILFTKPKPKKDINRLVLKQNYAIPEER